MPRVQNEAPGSQGEGEYQYHLHKMQGELRAEGVTSMYTVTEMTPEFAGRIASWSYEGVYSFYDFAAEDGAPEELLGGDYYAALGEGGNPAGFFCFGAAARIRADQPDAYQGEYLDFGLGMRPDLCGKGLGGAFVDEGLSFARARFRPAKFRLTVAGFNKRAVKTYERCGFRLLCAVTQEGTGREFLIMAKHAQ